MSDIAIKVENYLKNIDFSNTDFWSPNKDIFDARLQTFNLRSQEWLFGAVIGEVGFNTFDHNFIFPNNVKKGLYCNFEIDEKSVLLVDFGRGIKNSLMRVLPDIKNDMEALQIAFTEIISGRAPEQRGNGLKFVLNSVVNNSWEMFYKSGTAVCIADSTGYSFCKSDNNHDGCLCFLRRK